MNQAHGYKERMMRTATLEAQVREHPLVATLTIQRSSYVATLRPGGELKQCHSTGGRLVAIAALLQQIERCHARLLEAAQTPTLGTII